MKHRAVMADRPPKGVKCNWLVYLEIKDAVHRVRFMASTEEDIFAIYKALVEARYLTEFTDEPPAAHGRICLRPQWWEPVSEAAQTSPYSG